MIRNQNHTRLRRVIAAEREAIKTAKVERISETASRVTFDDGCILDVEDGDGDFGPLDRAEAIRLALWQREGVTEMFGALKGALAGKREA